MIDHVTALFANPVVVTVAVNCKLNPADIELSLGDTVTAVTVGATPAVKTTPFSNGLVDLMPQTWR